MSAAARAAGAPAAPTGAPPHGGVSRESQCKSTAALRSSGDGDRHFDSHVAGPPAANSGILVGFHHKEPGHSAAEEVGGPAAGREGNTLDKGRKSSASCSESSSSDQPPPVCPYSLRPTTDSSTQEPPAYQPTSEIIESQRLPQPAQRVEQRESSSARLKERVRPPSLQLVGTEAVSLTDIQHDGEDVITENAGTPGKAAALKSSIPSVLITSPSLGRISVLCPPVSCRSAQTAYLAEKSSASVWTIQADSEEDARPRPPTVLDTEDETPSTVHVGLNASPPVIPPPSLSSTSAGGSSICVGNTSLEREYKLGESTGWEDREAARLGTGYFLDSTRHTPPSEITDSVTSRVGSALPLEPEATARRHSGRRVDQAATPAPHGERLEVVTVASDRSLGSTAAFRRLRLEHTSAPHTHTSRSSSPMTTGRSGSHDERHRRICAVGSQRDRLQFVVPPGVTAGSENVKISQDGAGGPDSRRRFSLPAEGTLSSVIRCEGAAVPCVSPVTPGVTGRGEAFPWSERSVWRGHERRDRDGLDRKSRRQSVDYFLRSHHEDTDLRFLPQPSASQNGGGEGRASVLVGEEGTTVAAEEGTAVVPRAGFPPGGTFRYSRGGPGDPLAQDRIAAFSERKDTRSWLRAFEEGSQAASRDHRAAPPAVPGSAAVREQGIMRLQQPLLSTAFREAAHAAAAAARVRTSATTSGGKKTFSGAVSTPAGGREVSKVIAEPGSVHATSAARASCGDKSSSHHVKQGLLAGAELPAARTTVEGCTGEVIPERQLCWREAGRGLRTTSGISVASSDQSSATRASAERQQRELLLLRAKQRRVVGEVAALAACVAAASVKRAALHPVQQLILNTLLHWQRKVQPMPQGHHRLKDVSSQGGEKLQHTLLEAQKPDTTHPVLETGSAADAAGEVAAAFRCAETLCSTQTEVNPTNTVHGTHSTSAPLYELLRGTLPPCAEPAAAEGGSTWENSAQERLSRDSGEQPQNEQDGSTTCDLNCIRITLFASKQVLRWRHLRQPVAIFSEKTSPYYFWPPWGGFRQLTEAGGAALSSKLLMSGEVDGTDSDVARSTSARQIDLERSAADGECDGRSGGAHDCGSSRQKEGKYGELSSSESATPTSGWKKRVANEAQRVSEEESLDGKGSPVNEAKLGLAAHFCMAESRSTYATPTKTKPDFADAEIQRDTTATPSSPPALGESSHCLSPVSALVQKQGCQSVHSSSRQNGEGWQQRLGGSNCISVATDASCPSARRATASSALPRESRSITAGHDRYVDNFDVSCMSGLAATPGTVDRAGGNNEGTRISKRERTPRHEDPDPARVYARDTSYTERVQLLNYKDKHAVVPFLPNVLATRRATRGTTYRTASPPGPLRLPFEEAGTVYVLRGASFDTGSSSSEERIGVHASCRSRASAANHSTADTEQINRNVPDLPHASAREGLHEPRNTWSSPLQNTSASSATAEEEDKSLEQSKRKGMHSNTSELLGGSIIAMWACAASFRASPEKSEAQNLRKCSSSSSEDAACGQKRFWMCADTAGVLLGGGESGSCTAVGDTKHLRMNEAGQQCSTAFCAVQPLLNTTLSECISEPEIQSVSLDASRHPQAREKDRTLDHAGHQKKAEEVMKAMQKWCQAASKSGVNRDRPHDTAGSLKEISFESFASAYNDLAEEAVRQLLTQIRTRGEHALPPTACQLLEEKARIASRKRREEARCLQQQLRTELQQLVQNYNRLVTAEQNLAKQNSSPDRGHVDASQSSGHEHLEQQFQRRLRDLQQRVEYHLHQHRQLAALLMRHNARHERRRRSSYPGAQQLSGRRLPRRRLQWYSVGIRWLRTRAALEYFVVRHRQHDAGQVQVHEMLCDLAGRQRRMQRLNQENLSGQGEQPPHTGLSSGIGMSPPSNDTPPATCPSHTTEVRVPAGLKHRLPGSQRRGSSSSSSSGEDWRSSEQSAAPHSATDAACASGRSSVCGDEGNMGAFYLPTVPPLGPVGMSPVTVSEASTPATPDSPPLSSNEDPVSAVSSQGSFRQQSTGARTGTHNHTSTVLLLHELLQPMRLDAGGIRAVLVLVVLRLRRFIRVVRTKEQANNRDRQETKTCASSTSHENVSGSQRTHGRVDKETGADVPSADGSKAAQDCAPTWAKVFTSRREGMSLRAQLSELDKLQSDFTELSTTSAQRSLQCRKSAENTCGGDDTASSRTSRHVDLRCTGNSKFLQGTVGHSPLVGTASHPRSRPSDGREELTEVEKPRGEAASVSSMQRQFPYSSIRMALVLPNLGVQVQHILPSARSACGPHPAYPWMGATKDALADRDAGGSVYPGVHSRYTLYERDALTRRGAETFAALSQTSQQLNSGSQSPAPRRLGVAGLMGAADAAEARAARAAARAAAAETRIWRLREREENETRAGGLSDHAVYSGEGSVCAGKAERSRGRSSPERSIRKVDADGVNGTAGDEEEDDISGEPRSATTSGASLRKHGEMDNQNGQVILTRTPSPQLPQRVRRSCGIPSANRSDYAGKRKQLWPGSDEEPYAADTADSASRTRARSTVDETDEEGGHLMSVEGGALRPFWWRACCARYRGNALSLNERKSREQCVKTAYFNEVVGDGSQPSVAAEDGGPVREWNLKDIPAAEGKEGSKVASSYAHRRYPCESEAAEYSSRQGSAKSTQQLHNDVCANSSSHAHLTNSEQTQHMVPFDPPAPASSSSEITSSDEEGGSERGATTTSESSVWSKSSSTCSDISVEPSTVLQELPAWQVAAGTTPWSSTGELSLPGQLTRERCPPETRHAPQASLMKTAEVEVCNDGSTLMAEPAELSADVQPVCVAAPTAQEGGQQVTDQSESARSDALSGSGGVGGEALTRDSVECPPKSCLDQHEHLPTPRIETTLNCCAFSPTDTTKLQSLTAGEWREPGETCLFEQMISAAAPHLIVMPKEESVSADVREMLPQLRVRFTTRAVKLTSKEELEVLQANARHDCVTLRPRRAIRRLWNALYPVLRTLQMFSRTEEGRGGWMREELSSNLNTAGEVLTDADATDGPQVARSTQTPADLLCSSLLSAAAELATDLALPDSTGYSGLYQVQISKNHGVPISWIANGNAVTLAHRQRHVDTYLPRQMTTMLLQRIRRGGGVGTGAENTKQIDKLKTVIADAILYLSGILDVETAEVEAAKESAEDDALLRLLPLPGAQGSAGADSKAPGFHVERASRGVVDSRFPDAHTKEDGKWRKKRMKIEGVTWSSSTDTPPGELRPIKRPTYSLGRQGHLEASEYSESLFDFGPKRTSPEEATSKIVLRCPRAFGRRTSGPRRSRLQGVRSGRQGDTSAFCGSAKNDTGAEATWQNFSLKERRLAFRFSWDGDEGTTTRRWESRGRTPVFLRPDGWEALDDETDSSSSVDKTSAYAPLSSGSESVYLSVPSSPRRRRQQRQLRWRSRHLAVGTGGAYHLTSAELGDDFTQEGLERSFLDSPKRAYGGRAPRRVGVGSVFRIFQNSGSSARGAAVLQGHSSSLPLSPPLTRGAAATTPRGSQIYTHAEALSAGQGDAKTQSECATRERRRTTEQDRLFTRYLPEKLSKHQFAAASPGEARRKSSVGRKQRNRVAPVTEAPSLDWSGPECSLGTPTRKKMSPGPVGASQSTSKSHSSAGGIRHHSASSEGATAALPAGAAARSASTAAGRGSNLDSPRETPRPGRRTPTASSPVPTGVYFDASRKLWRCQWRENGRFKTKGFSLNTYGTLKDARKACIIYRCLMGGWEVDPRWLADNDSQDSGDNGLSEGHTLEDEDSGRAPVADGSQSEVEHCEVGDVAQCGASASIPSDATDSPQPPSAPGVHCDGVDAEGREIAMHATGDAKAADISCDQTADPMVPHGSSP